MKDRKNVYSFAIIVFINNSIVSEDKFSYIFIADFRYDSSAKR